MYAAKSGGQGRVVRLAAESAAGHCNGRSRVCSLGAR
jgi:hypothetical protein